MGGPSVLLKVDEEEWMSLRIAIYVAVILQALAPIGTCQDAPLTIPKRLEAMAPNQNFSAARNVTVTVTSRQTVNPDPSEDLEHLRLRVQAMLPKVPFNQVADKASADLWLEMIVEPNVRYGEFHSQNAPYVYLTLREPSGGHLVYCAYQRAGHFFSASERLLQQLKTNVQHAKALPSDSLAACAKQAMRPL